MTNAKLSISVLGGGSFGTALAEAIGRNNHSVTLWMRDQNVVDEIMQTHENTKYYPGYKLNSNIKPTTSVEEAIKSKELIFYSLPSKIFREVANKTGDYTNPSQILISTTKGLEHHSFKTMTEVLMDETNCLKLGALSGPNLSGEMMDRLPTGTVIASAFDEVIKKVQMALSSSSLRVYANRDVQGVELGGTLKNIYAICSGLITALHFGENTRSLMMSRALAEMSRFACMFGANPLTFIGLSGVGDLIATCSSRQSRNFQIGYQLGLGKNIEQAKEILGQTAEGIRTIEVTKQKADELKCYMPILDGMYAIVYERKPVKEVLEELMKLQHQEDVEFKTQIITK